MQFYQARPVPMVWMILAFSNLALSVERYHRHPAQLAFPLVQGVFWLLILCVWALIVTTRWTFTETSLVQRRAFWLRTVSYQSITAVEPPPGSRNREVAVIVYGGNALFSRAERLTVQPHDFAGFLAALERHAPQAVFHV